MASRQQQNNNHGIGAIATVKKRFLHPSRLIDEKYPNRRPTDELSGLLELRKEEKTVRTKLQMCIVMRHEDFPNAELYAVERWVKVTTAAPSRFVIDPPPEEAKTDEAAVPTDPNIRPGDTMNDAHQYLREGFHVDDDTVQNVENMAPGPSTAEYGEWGWDQVDPHRGGNHTRADPIFRADENGRPIDKENLLMSIFLVMLPLDFLTNTVLTETNKRLRTPMTLGEFLRFIGLWLVMATTEGSKQHEFWSDIPISMFDGAPYRFNSIMSGRRFRAIISALRLTSKEPPAFRDRFHEVRDLFSAFNANMVATFIPSWISTLDESVSAWFNRWTCPGWMFIPQKPHPFGNEYHTLCDGVWGVLYHLEIMEGKDRPAQLGRPKFEEHGKTVGLVMRCCASLFATGKCVIMDSGFCVLDALTRLKSYGVFALIMIKKKRSWPKGIPGNDVVEHMKDTPVGTQRALQGKHNGQRFTIFTLRNPDYTTMLMATFGAAIPIGVNPPKVTRSIPNGEIVNGTERATEVSFELFEPFELYYKYRGAVDNHNGRRHAPISLEKTWATKQWEHRAFAFVLSICEINTYLVAMNNFDVDKGTEVLQLRKKLAQALIGNTLDVAVGIRKRDRGATSFYDEHILEKAPPFALKYAFGDWMKSEKERYPQRHCTDEGCTKRIRTYCRCSPGIWLCTEHHSKHVFISKINNEDTN